MLIEFVQIPLVEGQGISSLVLCPISTMVFEQVQNEIEFSEELLDAESSQYNNTTNKTNLNDDDDNEISVGSQRQIQIVSECWNKPQTLPLLLVHVFCHNCRHREAYKKSLLRQNQLASSGVVIIPQSGVPNDFVIKTDLKVYDNNQNNAIDENDKHSEKVTLQDIKWIFQ